MQDSRRRHPAWIVCLLRRPDRTTGPSAVSYFINEAIAKARYGNAGDMNFAEPSQADERIARVRGALAHGRAHRMQRSATGADDDLRVLEF